MYGHHRANMFFDKLLNNKLDYVTAHKRDFIHIEDLCEAVEVIMDSKFNGSLMWELVIVYGSQDIRPICR